MHFVLSDSPSVLRSQLAAFVELIGRERWTKRLRNLRREMERSPFSAKVVCDYHWLELELDDQLVADARSIEPQTVICLQFAQAVVECHRQLSGAGRRNLLGRLADAIRSDGGFAPLYLEIDRMSRLLEAEFEVELSDMERLAQYDFRFWKGTVEGEVECKSLSPDAGRRIHRRDFYRFMNSIGDALIQRLLPGSNEVILIDLVDRLPSDESRQGMLRDATLRFMSSAGAPTSTGSFFMLTRERSPFVPDPSGESERLLHRRYRRVYGDNCHVACASDGQASATVVMRSHAEDDHSRPQLEALKYGANQLSGTRPGFICVQYNEITAQDLLSVDLRRRAGLLSHYLFREKGADHVCGTTFSTYGGFGTADGSIGVPSFAIPNPMRRFHIQAGDYPFLQHVPDDDFARFLGASPPAESISSVPLERSAETD